MTTANKITIGRIILIPVFVMMAIYYGRSVQRGEPLDWQRWLAISIYVVAAASDGVDGYIARHYNQRSRLGVVLDPIADKGLLLAGIITLSFTNWSYQFPLWFPVLVIARDIIVVAGALTLHFLNGAVKVKPSWTGKTATVFQMLALALAMLQINPFQQTFRLTSWKMEFDTIDFAVAFAGLFTAISGVGYVLDGIRQIHDKGHGDPKPWSDD
jgi:cardiolipin synthase (CMP-forming)